VRLLRDTLREKCQAKLHALVQANIIEKARI